MNYDLQFISVLFLVATMIYLYWGGSIMKLDVQASTHRLFLLVCLSLAIWSFSFGMANAATHVETVLLWHRISSLGWTTAYGFILHFLILLATAKPTLKQRWLLLLLHIPGLIGLYVFGISSELAPRQYNLTQINYGWINELTNNHWDSLFNIYYMTYILIGIALIWTWQHKLEDQQIARRARFIALAIIISYVVGSFTDRFASLLMDNPLPQVAPLFIFIPTWAMYRSAKYHGAMDKKQMRERDLIVTAADIQNIFSKLAIAFYIAATLGFLTEYLPRINEVGAFTSSFITFLIIFSIGLLIRVTQLLKNDQLKENLTIIILIISIPVILLQFIDSGSTTVWAYPIVIILSSIIFSRRTLLIATTIVAIMTQLSIYLLRPEAVIMVNYYDYLLRVGMLMVAFLAGLFINKMYVDKIKENEFQMGFQQLNAKLSSEFITLNRENIDDKINLLLQEAGRFFEAERVSLFSISREDGLVTYTHEWVKEEPFQAMDTFEHVMIRDYPWWMQQLEDNKVVSIEDTRTIPPEAQAEQLELHKLDVKSVISVPIEGANGFHDFLMISSVTAYRSWPQHDVKLLHILATLLSEAYLKIETEQAVERLAYYDNLTGLPNRVLFKNRVTRAIKELEKENASFHLIYLDLDNFSSVNGLIGYAGGDQLLKVVASRLDKVVGEAGWTASFNGDEFMIYLKPMKQEEKPDKIIERIMNSFMASFHIQGQEFLLTCSAGIAQYPADGVDADTLIENAEIAMKYAEDKGRSQYAICTQEMKEQVAMKIALLNDLTIALEREELVLHYQPQVDLSTGKINGVEALVRWEHPVRGMISPGLFIPLAEENGLINDIGKWVLQTAAQQSKQWQDQGLPHLKMGVNLSAIQLIDVNLVAFIVDVLAETGLAPEALELEVTETVTIEEVSYVEQTLQQLKDMGIEIAIDDFGTAYSSFSRLKTMPIDRIKIDMQFIQGLDTCEKDRTITKTMIDLAKGLNVSVIAEGVETKEQLDYLKDNNCDEVQGYYYYRPLPAEAVEALFLS